MPTALLRGAFAPGRPGVVFPPKLDRPRAELPVVFVRAMIVQIRPLVLSISRRVVVTAARQAASTLTRDCRGEVGWLGDAFELLQNS